MDETASPPGNRPPRRVVLPPLVEEGLAALRRRAAPRVHRLLARLAASRNTGNGDGNGTVGRGFLYVTGAKLYFLLTATFTSVAFPRLFGDPVVFGRFRVVSALLNVVTMVAITATVQAVSRLTAEAGADVAGVRRAALAVQTVVFGAVFLAMIGFAGLLAGRPLADPSLAMPLRAASFVVLAYAWYAVLVGVLNGRRRFAAQATLDVTFSTLKTGLMVAAVVLSGSVTLAFGGFAVAAFGVLAIAALFAAREADGPVWRLRAPSPALVRRYLCFLLPLAAYALVLNVLLQADVVAVKIAVGGGWQLFQAGTVADQASAAAGIYGAARNVALLPYQAVISLTFIVFPFVSRSASAGDGDQTAAAAGGAMRIAAVLAFASVVVFGAAPAALLGGLFGEAYAAADGVTVPLLVAGALTALMFVGNAILASLGRPGLSVVAGLAAMVTQVGALFLMLRRLNLIQTVWEVAAVAAVLGAGVGVLVTVRFLSRALPDARFGRTVTRAFLAMAVGVFVAWTTSRSLVPVARVVLGAVVFCLVIWRTRAVEADDLRRVAALFGRRRAVA